MLIKASIIGLGFVSASSLNATPLTKVVNLLKEMRNQNEEEMKQDQEIYDKLACWCHTNREEKSAAVEEAQAKIEQLTSDIKGFTAKYAQLGEDISHLKKDIKENEESLEAASAQRAKEAEEFHTMETDSVQALGQLKGAITILKKHQDGFLDVSTLNQIKNVLNRVKGANANLSENGLNLLQSRPYANQSGEIFGILESMKETMEADLSEAQKAEVKAVETFNAMRDAKREEIAAARTQLEEKEGQYADTGLKNAQAKKDLAETTAQLEADQAFLVDLEKKCALNEKEMEARTKTRNMEIQAINETIEILTADDSRDVANKTLVFMQIKATKTMLVRQRAQRVLKRVALKTGNPELSMLASSVQLDAFTKLKKSIDNMIAQLKIEMADEVKHKDFCNDEFHTNEMQTTKANRELDALQANKADLEASIEKLSDELKQLSSEIKEMRVQLQSETLDRQEESKNFQKAVDEQIEMQQILQKAIKRLESFYSPKEESLLQQGPPGLKQGGYKKNAGSTGVIGMIQEIVADSKEAEAEIKKDEQDAQTAYEESVATTNAGVAERQKMTVTKHEAKATAEKELVQCKENISSKLTDLEKLAEYNTQLHKECDFVVKNFDVRQTGRGEEIEALQQAKSILSGAQ